MMKLTWPFLLAMVLIVLTTGCHTPRHTAAPVTSISTPPSEDFSSLPKNDSLLENLLSTRPQFFGPLLQQRKALQLQIIYTQINRTANNEPVFTPYYFNTDNPAYFYPASTVKMPVAFLALQALNELHIPSADKDASMLTAPCAKQTAVYNDPSTVDGRPTVANYIKKIFLVSDNDAYNRLYEMLGQDYINDRLHKMGYKDAQLLHRLELIMTPEENRHTNAVTLYDSTGQLIYAQPERINNSSYEARHDSAGRCFYSKGKLVPHAMDFSLKNKISLNDLTDILRSVLFPSSVKPEQRFNFTEDDYRLVKRYMSEWPTESFFPPYAADSAAYWPAYCKFLLYGSAKGPVQPNIRIFNKVGDAYGFLTDVAYVVDFDKNIEFMLSARIYCNADGILNDDAYDYETVGFPFMKELGKLIYDYELNRPRNVRPDLAAFKIDYDK